MKIHFEKTLYKVHSTGQIGSWNIKVFDCDDGTAIMVRESKKVLGGQAVQTNNEYTEGKNIGRANETTPLQQATFEAQGMCNKQLDKGYVPTMPKPGDKATNALGFIKPMLAQPIEKVKDWSYPVFVQPKLDGHRMLATVQDDQVVLYSRQGKVLDVEHIRMALQRLYDDKVWSGTTIDGEVYLHGETLQRISSLVKKPKPESKELNYHVYDLVTEECYSQRIEKLFNTINESTFPSLSMSATHTVSTEEKLNELHGAFIGAGYEGTIVRQLGIGYEDGKRSKSLMKKKDFQDAEFEITGITEGKPNERHNLSVGIYLCKTDDGKEFSVTAPGDMHEKHDHAVNGNSNVGKKLTIKFFNYTPDGIPFHLVALRIRDDI